MRGLFSAAPLSVLVFFGPFSALSIFFSLFASFLFFMALFRAVNLNLRSGYRRFYLHLHLFCYIMAESVIKPNVDSAPQGEEKVKRIRITLTSRNVTALEHLCAELKAKAIKEGVAVAGPVRMPTKKLRITTRKSPCGEGTNTWDRWEMRIHKRILDLHATTSIVRTITSVDISPDIEVAVNVSNSRRRRR